jgi:hypothetical protein
LPRRHSRPIHASPNDAGRKGEEKAKKTRIGRTPEDAMRRLRRGATIMKGSARLGPSALALGTAIQVHFSAKTVLGDV